ncbi:MAG: bifunctional demethylmenaquinone methyltransferase/2-methoxy-6-polyprenyl-1,4-benzoquinol methylase UbiE [Terriglobia bacterium]
MRDVLPQPEQKEAQVQEMFTSSAPRYDLVNTVLSFGLHKLWKRTAVVKTGLEDGQRALDLCSGTNDLAILLGRRVGKDGQVVAVDFNREMIALGAAKVQRANMGQWVSSRQGNAESLDLESDLFDALTIAFGLRNIRDQERALSEMHRVLKPGGRLVCLEFSVPPNRAFRRLYDFYSFNILPHVGTIVSGDKSRVYHYLPASIREFHTPEALRALLEKVGFRNVEHRYLSAGIVGLHSATK